MIVQNLKEVQERIHALDKNQHVTLIAVSKTKPASDLQQAIDAGQRHFGENYLQEALEKIETLKNQDLIWHFIGPIQSNKAKQISQNFDWVHSVDRLKIAKRLNDQRPKNLEKLNVLLQVNIDNEATKSGVLEGEIEDFILHFENFQNITLRGFMCIPNPNNAEQSFKKMAEILQKHPNLDTLSMGMSTDLELAIENGANFVRIGTDIFGKRA
ncbi:MAG TPA: YggS family pyridoxal phosphate-dependent enzyme [Gammaproteobacteria bacterium]|jgi:pyridoxal phosphate enzyme (YggS family)|nr:YggS family pyridoxal phosphate-dependent enzyme [Gammaproteobacteria bacterium]HAE04593.1 YggS family pyridoxal phosphate-dependent enzyme [Gammaproteobacteria bacterium]HAE70043.1 YggS family pyridoxal phosphate-dependent enzyme [Gammaproteobacteria bacterium]HAE73385.1 YggS family pyridoxal phosphate-dependent enzyme [Gammaproteobacteria bacterium]HAG47575.1 YggS family pyridoxal phosphate-dependent enzyme [Gammaproteobacteria bacterium]